MAHRPTGAEVPWTNHNLTESFPGLTSTLTYSQAQVFYQMGFADFYRRMGVGDRSLRRNRHHLSGMIGYLDGRVYYRLDAWFALHGQIPGFDLMRPLWERSLGLTGRTGVPREATGRPWLRVLRATPRLAVLLARQPRETRAFLRWWDALVADSASLDGSSTDELIARYRHLWAEAERRWGVTMVNSYFGLANLAVTSVLLKRWVPGGEALLPRLVSGGRPNRSLASVRSAIALAELANQRPPLREAVLQRPEREVWDEITASRYGDEVAAAFARPGHLRRPRAARPEAGGPHAAAAALDGRVHAAPARHAGVDRRRQCGRGTARQDRGPAYVTQGVPQPGAARGPRRPRRLPAFFATAREDTRFCRSQLYGISRDVLWRLADRMVAAGMLDEAGDVAHLRVEEVLGAFDGTLPDADLRGPALRRKAELAARADKAELPAYFTTPAEVPVSIGLASRRDAGKAVTVTDGVLRGLASSSGRVRGRARVVLDPATSPESCADRILVARETDPGWLPLMMAARGMVVERGSLVSHTAITGRLLGIPTVVAVVGASAVIPDGAPLEIDGDNGTVRLLSEAELDASMG